MMDTDRQLRFHNQDRLRNLKRRQGSEVTIFCSHDQRELEAMQAREPVHGRPRPPMSEAPPGSAEGLG